ncbi:hypothetical protein [Bacterioplanoides sp.]|uniref:hypothetical protein n=1 Tax=Bacterioplanoides sp. TaxID=2066072 RepID=UPI003AFFF2E7
MRNVWKRIVGVGRKKLISGALIVGLAAVGVSLPEPAVTALAVGLDALVEVI